jgi:hypothetical protein
MSSIPAHRWARPYEQAAAVLACLGIVAAFALAWYVGTVLSVAAGGVLANSIWIRHQPMTRWTRITAVLVLAGIIVQLVVGLTFTPVTPVRAG